MKKSLILLSSVLLLSSCATSESQTEPLGEKALKPLVGTAGVVRDSVGGVNMVMEDAMKKVNSAIAIPVEERDDPESKDKSDSKNK